MPIKMLTDLLDRNNIRYTVVSHPTAFTAQGLAALTHTPGKELAKTVIINMDDVLAMAVLPASSQVDLSRLQAITGAKSIRLAREHEFTHCFPGCETGAMPPFGNLYGMTVFVDKSLAEDAEIAFNAGSHQELMRIRYRDFEQIVQPTILQFASRARVRAA